MKRLFLTCLLALTAPFTLAYGLYDGTVKDVRIDRGGLGIIAFDGPIVGNPPACRSSNYIQHMSFNTNTDGGKAIYAMALAAVASGKKVSVVGLGSCSDYVNVVESLSYWRFLK